MRSDRETALPHPRPRGRQGRQSEGPGGRTNKGVTQRVFDAYRVARGLPKLDVWKISAEDVTRIYQDQYLDTIDYDRLPAGLNYAVADYAVNSGPARAIKDLQRNLLRCALT